MAFQGLPVELVRRIFELPTDHPTMATLALVCRSSNTWVTPRLYSTMIIDTPSAGRCFIDLLRHKPASFFSRVKRLSLVQESILVWSDDAPNCVRHVLSDFVAAFRHVDDLQAPVPVLAYLQTRADFTPGPRRVWYSSHLEKLDWPETAQEDVIIDVTQVLRIERMQFDRYYAAYIPAAVLSFPSHMSVSHLTHASFSMPEYIANDRQHSDQTVFSIRTLLVLRSLLRIVVRFQGTSTSARETRLWALLIELEDERIFAGSDPDKMFIWIQTSVNRFADTGNWEDDYWMFGEQIWRNPNSESGDGVH